jgi:hypothetical protein
MRNVVPRQATCAYFYQGVVQVFGELCCQMDYFSSEPFVIHSFFQPE